MSEPLLLSELLENLDKIIVHEPKPCSKGGQICNITYGDSRTPLRVQMEPPTPVRFNVNIRTTDWKGDESFPNIQMQKSLVDNQSMVTDLSKLTAAFREKLFEQNFEGKDQYEDANDPVYRRFFQNLVYTEKKSEKRAKYGDQHHIRYSVPLAKHALHGDKAISGHQADEYRTYGAIEWKGDLYYPEVQVENFQQQRMPMGINALKRGAMTLDIVRIGYLHIGEKGMVVNMQVQKTIVFSVPTEQPTFTARDYSQYMSLADPSAALDQGDNDYAGEEPPAQLAKRARVALESEGGDEEKNNDGEDGTTML